MPPVRSWLGLLVTLIVGAHAAASPPLELEGALVQGGLVRGQVPPGSEVSFAGRALRVDPDGRFLFGFGRDEASGPRLTVRYPDGSEAARRLEIARARLPDRADRWAAAARGLAER